MERLSSPGGEETWAKRQSRVPRRDGARPHVTGAACRTGFSESSFSKSGRA